MLLMLLFVSFVDVVGFTVVLLLFCRSLRFIGAVVDVVAVFVDVGVDVVVVFVDVGVVLFRCF